MLFVRLLRIAAIAAALLWMFTLSQRAGAVRGNEPVPGLSWALSVLSLIFTAGAIVTERSRGPEANLQKDLLWGLAAGSVLTILSRLS